ncbi:MAG: translation initiation factor IF-3 [Nitrospirae bacterium]|nr:MAG: translation initiation factor IF-3 [Nitrospirota bacterium]
MAVQKLRINREIRVTPVRVIGPEPESEQLGILTTADALKKAEDLGYDLVEISPTAQPPVCKIMDFGKYKYELSKKAHVAKQHQKGTQLKEVKLRPRTDQHDLETKVRQMKEFLAEGNKTKVTVMFRGREMAYQQMGRAMLDKVMTLIGTGAQIEQPPRQEGRFLMMVLAPKK